LGTAVAAGCEQDEEALAAAAVRARFLGAILGRGRLGWQTRNEDRAIDKIRIAELRSVVSRVTS